MPDTGRSDMVDIRHYRPSDRPAVEGLLHDVYGPNAPSAAAFTWRHFGHPTAPSLMQVAAVDDEIVGIQPMEIHRFAFSGMELLGAVLITFVLQMAVDANIVAAGLCFALAMGFAGGLLPALSAVRLKALDALR